MYIKSRIRTSYMYVKQRLGNWWQDAAQEAGPYRREDTVSSACSLSAATHTTCREKEFFIDNLLDRIHFVLVMIRWTGLAPWEFEHTTCRETAPSLVVRRTDVWINHPHA